MKPDSLSPDKGLMLADEVQTISLKSLFLQKLAAYSCIWEHCIDNVCCTAPLTTAALWHIFTYSRALLLSELDNKKVLECSSVFKAAWPSLYDFPSHLSCTYYTSLFKSIKSVLPKLSTISPVHFIAVVIWDNTFWHKTLFIALKVWVPFGFTFQFLNLLTAAFIFGDLIMKEALIQYIKPYSTFGWICSLIW